MLSLAFGGGVVSSIFRRSLILNQCSDFKMSPIPVFRRFLCIFSVITVMWTEFYTDAFQILLLIETHFYS